MILVSDTYCIYIIISTPDSHLFTNRGFLGIKLGEGRPLVLQLHCAAGPAARRAPARVLAALRPLHPEELSSEHRVQSPLIFNTTVDSSSHLTTYHLLV